MRARRELEPRFTHQVVQGAHDLMVTEPELLVRLLLEEVEASVSGRRSPGAIGR
jgi:hypothetical protein